MSDNTDQANLTDGEEENEKAVDHESMEDSEGVDPHETEYHRGDKRPIDHGAKIRGKLTRGSEPRDKDTLLIEGRGEDAGEAAADFEAALQEAEEREWADRLRALQPGEGEDDG